MIGLFLQKIKKVITISEIFWKKIKIIESGGLIKAVNFTTDHWIHWCKNDIAIYSTNNEGKSVVGERFIRILKNKIWKYMTSTSKNF